VNLQLPLDAAAGYKSPSRRAGLITEAWATQTLYCANCSSPRLERLRTNTPAKDFVCPKCESAYQLKSQGHPFGRKVLDAEYKTMVGAIREDTTLNLLVLHYSKDAWQVVNLVLVPRFALSVSAIEKRKPLRSSAERANWVGCYIVLERIPLEARIPIVREGMVRSKLEVREAYRRLRPLERLRVESRGWTLDVLAGIRSLNKREFSLGEAYSLESHLSALHPANRNVRPKIRQQLQELRDMGLVDFLGAGRYRLE